MRTESYLVAGRDRIEPVKSLQGLRVKVKPLSAHSASCSDPCELFELF